MSDLTEQRKDEHIEIVLRDAVEHRHGALLDCVELLHQSLPELSLDEVDCTVTVWERTLRAPLVVTGMTGGTDRAGQINRQLAEAAEAAGVALGVGSMRPLLQNAARRADYDLRAHMPSAPLLGNLGAVQARDVAPAELGELLGELGYDALCLHLNPAQELAQGEGDRDFRGVVDTIARYHAELGLPLIVKETGAGLSPQALRQIRSLGVRWVDVSGRGGTSWTKVESLRGNAEAAAQVFADWGLPTAACTAWAAQQDLLAIASGGVRGVGDILRALALGARLVGAARPVLVTLDEGGVPAATALLEDWIEGLRRGMVLVGARDLVELTRVPRVILPPLDRWLEAGL